MTDSPQTRTQQNSLYKWERITADALNDAGIPLGEIIFKLPTWVTQENIHLLAWKPVQMALYPEIESSTNLSTEQTIEIHRHVDHTIALRTGVTMPWPDRFNRG